jgi:hypothetical protein
MPDVVGNPNACTDPPCVWNGKLHDHWQDIKNSKAILIRYGGSAVDKNMPTNAQYIQIIDSIRANGMEPIIQVPFYNYRYTAQQAADIVKFINVTSGKNIKYWVIGNEPDLAYSFNTSSQVSSYIKSFSSAMKTVDPSIFIIGPECAWFDKNIIDGLTTANGADDITGKDANGRFYLDFISFHRYAFNGTQTRAQVISFLKSSNGLEQDLIYLNARVAACNTAHGRMGASALKTALTEANIDYQNSSSDNLSGVGATSFIGGQFIAEMLGVGMKNNLDFINMWSVMEGSGSVQYNIGYLDGATGNKLPAYYHYQLVAENFSGSYADGISNNPNVKAFGCKNGNGVCVMILNEDMSNFHYTIRLDNGSFTIINPLQINISAGMPQEFSDVIAGQSSVLLSFNTNGAITKKCEYALNVQAVNNQPPNCVNYSSPTGIAEVNPATVSENTFDINVFPNPSLGHISVTMNKGDIKENIFELFVFNEIGQQVFAKKYDFASGREEIDFPDGLADGIYFVRLKEGNKDKFLTKKIILQRK